MKKRIPTPGPTMAVLTLVPLLACARTPVDGAAAGVAAATPSAEPVSRGLDWLVRHQAPAGYWSASAFSERCGESRCDGAGKEVHDPGATGLSLLALQVAGDARHADAVARGLAYLASVQDAETGCFGVPNSHATFLYDHGIATLAVAEAVARGDDAMRGPAQRGIDFIEACRNPYKAWRYAYPPDGNNDMSVTGWMVLALKTGQSAGLEVDPAAFQGAMRLTDEMTDDETWRTGYQRRGGFSSRDVGMEERWPEASTEAMTAVGMMARLLTGEDPDESAALKGGAARLRDRLPEWDEANGTIDYSYWYYGTLAMSWIGGDGWDRWSGALAEAVERTQREDGCARGSWDPQFDPWGHAGGRVYATALLTLALAVRDEPGRWKIAG
ncbi:MAG: hypothetical protein ACF8XB_25360 [Planctomycetota bacterium JB042]